MTRATGFRAQTQTGSLNHTLGFLALKRGCRLLWLPTGPPRRPFKQTVTERCRRQKQEPGSTRTTCFTRCFGVYLLFSSCINLRQKSFLRRFYLEGSHRMAHVSPHVATGFCCFFSKNFVIPLFPPYDGDAARRGPLHAHPMAVRHTLRWPASYSHVASHGAALGPAQAEELEAFVKRGLTEPSAASAGRRYTQLLLGLDRVEPPSASLHSVLSSCFASKMECLPLNVLPTNEYNQLPLGETLLRITLW